MNRAIAALADQALSSSSPEQSRRMLSAAARSRRLFDGDAQEALTIASTDETLFRRYWCNRSAFEHYAETTASASSGFDLNTFVALWAQLDAVEWTLPAKPRVDATLVVLGAGDPVVDADWAARFAARWATNPAIHTFVRCGHWPHLEAPEQFCDLLESQWS